MLAERRSSFPLLSPTFRSHQLWTPLYLDRLTINQKSYHDYLKRPRPVSDPLHRLRSEKARKYGDNGFFLQKDLPIEQKYDCTQILRSTIRPWDQLVPRPLTTSQILNKESHLPFPSQHPYTSHISQFAVFPESCISAEQHDDTNFHHEIDTGISNDNVVTGNEGNNTISTKVHASTQTDCSCFNQDPSSCSIPLFLVRDRAPANEVKSKAFSNGLRVEYTNSSYVHSANQGKGQALNLRPGIYRWDISRAHPRKFQSSMTYPAPSTMYAPRSHPMAISKSLLNPTTFKALTSVNTRVATSTSYKNNYPIQSRLLFKRDPDMTISSAQDSRGKYARLPQFSSVSASRESNRLKAPHQVPIASVPKTAISEHAATSISNVEKDNARNQATQTDDTVIEDPQILAFEEQNDVLADTHICRASPTTSEYESYLQPSSRGSSTSGDHESFIDQCLDHPYSKTEAHRDFHMQYPSHTPDLREFSISSGRRHIINGYHAYYWH